MKATRYSLFGIPYCFCFFLVLICVFVVPVQATAEGMKAKKAEARSIQLIENGNVVFQLDFKSFEKEANYADEPFGFSSLEAESLWRFLVGKNSRLRREPKDMKFMGASFASLGQGTYLIEHDAFYHARPNRNELVQLTTALPPGNFELGEIRRLPNNKFWLLLSGSNYDHDVLSQVYDALFFEKMPDASYAITSAHVAGFACRGYENQQLDGLCGDGADPTLEYPALTSAALVNKLVIKDANNDGKEDIIIYITEQNCKTKKMLKKEKVFINRETHFIEKSPTRRRQ